MAGKRRAKRVERASTGGTCWAYRERDSAAQLLCPLVAHLLTEAAALGAYDMFVAHHPSRYRVP